MSPTAITPEQFVTFGELLKYLRRQARITQRELAIAVGYSDTQISRIEQNQRVPDSTTITALFVPALYIEQEPKWVMRLLELAKSAHVDGALGADGNAKPATPHNLPIQLTSFIGREKEIAEISQLLETHRLVTLTGSGGIGKTRLSLLVASESIASFPHGVWLVEFAPISDPALVPFALANLFGLRESGESKSSLTELLIEYLRTRKVLLVFDNCEHLIEATARLADLLLQACNYLFVLASSREALGVKGELAYRVPSLNIPDPTSDIVSLMKSESVSLFVERALDVSPDFSLTPNNASAVAQICHRLDGIPLAIELAAARVKMLSVDQISSRLDDRFHLLTGGARTALPRQQTLRSTIDWSYDLLSESERLLLCRLAVFSGGWTLELAEQVCSDERIDQYEILDMLSKLVDKSLVTVVQEKTGTRYRMLETIYQYALEKLGETVEAPAIRDQHLRCFLSLAEKSEPNLFGREAAAWFARLDKELDNIRAAMRWSTNSGKADMALRIAGSLVFFWLSYGLAGSEWQDRVQQALSRPEGKERTLARAKALNGIGLLYWTEIFPMDKRQELEEALSIGREFGDQRNIATALRNLGLLENIKGNYLEAQTLLEQSLMIWREMGSDGKAESASTLIFLGDVALNHGEAKWAHSLYEEAVRILREIGDITFLAYVVRRLGQLLWREGDYEAAVVLCKESLDLNLAKGDPRGIMACLAGFAAIAVAQGKFERAARLMATVETQLTTIGIQLLSLDKMEYERNLILLSTHLNKKTLDKFWATGATISTEEAVKYALEESND